MTPDMNDGHESSSKGFWHRQKQMIPEVFVRKFLMLIPCAVAVAVPLYNAIEPKIFGIPLFYWSQLFLVPVTALFILAAYLGEKNDR